MRESPGSETSESELHLLLSWLLYLRHPDRIKKALRLTCKQTESLHSSFVPPFRLSLTTLCSPPAFFLARFGTAVIQKARSLFCFPSWLFDVANRPPQVSVYGCIGPIASFSISTWRHGCRVERHLDPLLTDAASRCFVFRSRSKF